MPMPDELVVYGGTSCSVTDRTAVFQAIRTNQSKQFITRRFGVHPYFAFYKFIPLCANP